MNQSYLRSCANELKVPLTSFFAMAMGNVPKDPRLSNIGKRYDKSAAQVVLRWIYQLGDIPLTRSTKLASISENIAIFDFSLTENEMAEITSFAHPDGRILSPIGLAPVWD